jgi:uncharacterized protein
MRFPSIDNTQDRIAIGVGFKPQHLPAIFESPAAIHFFEVHAENYMGAGGPAHAQLTALRRDFPLSVHGVGLSIGGSNPLDKDHLERLKTVCDRYQPALISEHLAWTGHEGLFLNDLLPLPLTHDSLARTLANIDRVQEALQRKILIENPATYLRFEESTITEPEFLAELAQRSGCGLLLDINNVYVSSQNHGFDANTYLNAFPHDAVGEIHLAGHSIAATANGETLLIDTHGEAVSEPVFALYLTALRLIGPVPTLIERDNNIPNWPELAAEAEKAAVLLRSATPRHAAPERVA